LLVFEGSRWDVHDSLYVLGNVHRTASVLGFSPLSLPVPIVSTVTRVGILLVLTGDCPFDFCISQLRFAKIPLKEKDPEGGSKKREEVVIDSPWACLWRMCLRLLT
jgi:hypothetical protein